MMDKELRAKLHERLGDESGDVALYEKLANMARQQGCYNLSEYLMAIARDEKTHETFLKEYLATYDEDLK